MNRIVNLFVALVLSCTLAAPVFAQGGYEVKGVIVDQAGPVIGATVLEKGTTNGVSTGLDGDFVLRVSSADAIVEVSCIGYSSQTFTASQMPAKITISEDALFLDDVVVIGYGTVKKDDMTGSVSTVRADQINKGMISSPSQLLAGKSGGVVVTAGDGQPGSKSTIRIRGGSSLKASNDPMIIIDGLPISNSGINGVADALSSVNPNDIESFTVLKDASATAIYGSRASNGVIIITTKKGVKSSSKVPHVSADFTTSLSQNAKYLDVMTGDEMRQTMAEYAGTDSDAYKALGDANTNWQKEIYQLGQTYEGNVGISGNIGLGNAGYLPYRVSGGYLDQKGTLKTSSMKRGTVSVNLNPTLLDSHLTISLNGKAMFMKNRFANTGAIAQAVEYDPTQPVYDSSSNGHNGYRIWGTDGIANTQSTLNPVASLNEKKDLSNANRFIGNAQIDYKIHGLEDLRLNVNLGIDYSYSEGTVDILADSEQSLHSQTEAGRGRHTDYTQKRIDKTLEAYLAYNKDFNKDHHFDIMAGYSWQNFWNESSNYEVALTDGTIYKESYPKSEYYLISFFGRLNYSYASRYLLTASLRYDGTSRFANNKWGLFPSVAFAWNIKNENFLKDVNALSALKLRLSWGQTGQQELNAGDYPTLATYKENKVGSYYYFGNQLVIPTTALPYNADLKWETTTTYNAGIDLGFLDGRLTASVDGYYRKTTDLLNYTPVPAGSNLKNYLDANIGTLENYGVELDLNYIAIQNKDWFWQIGLNGAWNKNKITQLTTNDNEDYKGVDTGDISGGVGNKIQKYMVGYPVNTFYVYQQIYDTEGNPIMGAYVDRNGDGKIDLNDRYFYKKAAPDVTIGFNTTLSYKKWTLAVSAHANLGNWVYDNNSSRLSLMTDLWTNNFVANRVPQAAKDNFTTAQYFSDYYVRNASFFKLDNITLGYTFGLPKDMTLNLFGTVQNVCCASGYKGIDPEVFNGIDNNIWPRPRTYVVGLKFNF
ncbi:MAG: TonB-dependent receptor [Bacteroidales bacterium]|nr:TonB-dependent receptor [Bacteroidales bacterium]MDY5262781.1 TonB-dependent receptor [Candidatus Cryptobacteroides sp.]MDY5570147.1 TonB-dependent receptor [Candidatus Cryptobacteroides sp.]